MIPEEQVIDWYISAIAEGASIFYRWADGVILAESERDAIIIRDALSAARRGGITNPPAVVVAV